MMMMVMMMMMMVIMMMMMMMMMMISGHIFQFSYKAKASNIEYILPMFIMLLFEHFPLFSYIN